MKRFKTIFYVVYFLFLLVTLGFVFYLDTMFDRFGMMNFLDFLQYWAFFGILLYIGEWTLENVHIRRLKTRIRRLEKDNLNLKAKLFDEEEEKKGIDRSLKSFEDSIDKKDKSEPEDEENQE